jgi:putative ABC transport system ATP-binding protein
VLEDVTLRLPPGSFVAVTGPSGSGKTTLAHICALLDRPSAGRLLFRGEDLTDLDDDERAERRKRAVGMVFQRFCLLPRRTARENVLFRFRYMDRIPADAEERADAVLREMGLEHAAERPARLLSGGETQRVAIARATVLQPDILVADEPTGNLDEASSDEVMRCFRRLHEAGMTVLLVTHNEQIAAGCTRRLHCHNGRLTEDPSP